MAIINLNDEVVNLLSRLVSLYMKDAPSSRDIKLFIKEKLEEKSVIASFKMGLITQIELCDFILSQVFSRYIQGNETSEVPEKQIIDIRDELNTLLFNHVN